MNVKRQHLAAIAWTLNTEAPETVRGARMSFRCFAHSTWGENRNVAAAELVVGELLSNVVRHAPGPIVFKADWSAKAVAISVADEGCGFLNVAIPTSETAESGRGLAIVRALATDVRVERIPSGCAVTATVLIGPEETSSA